MRPEQPQNNNTRRYPDRPAPEGHPHRGSLSAVRRFALRMPRTAAVCFGILSGSVLIVLLLVAGEIVIRLAGDGDERRRHDRRYTGALDEQVYAWDEILGYAPEPGIRFSTRLEIDGREIYDVTYNIDRNRRRRSPIANDSEPTKFAIFFGGSFTYGTGVEDDETLPARFGIIRPEYRTYNYGYGGYGPQQMLARMTEMPIREEIAEETGFAVYVFIDSHVGRAIGSFSVISGHGAPFPYYVEQAGRLVRKPFSEAHPVLSVLYSVLARSRLFERLDIDIPPRPSDSHFRLTARMIEESRDAFRARFGDRPFLVLMYPPATKSDRLVEMLKETGIPVLHYGNLFDVSESQYHLPEDWHPTPLSHDVVARQLARDLADMGL